MKRVATLLRSYRTDSVQNILDTLERFQPFCFLQVWYFFRAKTVQIEAFFFISRGPKLLACLVLQRCSACCLRCFTDWTGWPTTKRCSSKLVFVPPHPVVPMFELSAWPNRVSTAAASWTGGATISGSPWEASLGVRNSLTSDKSNDRSASAVSQTGAQPLLAHPVRVGVDQPHQPSADSWPGCTKWELWGKLRVKILLSVGATLTTNCAIHYVHKKAFYLLPICRHEAAAGLWNPPKNIQMQIWSF